MSLVLYGIVREEHPLPDPPLGIGDPRGEVRLIRSGPLAAVVSELEDTGTIKEDDGRIHLDILIQLLDDGPVAPLRFGSVAPDEEAVRTEVLDSVAEDLRGRLDAMDGLVELHLDADEDEEVSIQAVVAADPSLVPPTPLGDFDDRIQFGQLVAERVVERRVALAEELLAVLRPLAEQDSPRGHVGGPEDPTLRWAFLVRIDALAGFDKAVAELRAAYPNLVMEYVGPLPPASFLQAPALAGASATSTSTSESGSESPGRWGWGSSTGDVEKGGPL